VKRFLYSFFFLFFSLKHFILFKKAVPGGVCFQDWLLSLSSPLLGLLGLSLLLRVP
jgi:hypothetical protein